jgi:hypothetical protein
VPTNSTTRPRFAGSNNISRHTRFEQDTAPATTATGTGEPKPKRNRTSGARWANEQNVTAATKTNGRRGGRNSAQRRRGGTTRGEPAGDPGTLDEMKRREMIRDRNSRRRYPWAPAVGAILVGLLANALGTFAAWASGMVSEAADGATTVPTESVVLVVAATPLGVAAVMALRHRRTHLRWLPELAAAGAGSAVIVYWIGVAGLSWLTVLVVLVATIAGGSRWWKAHPIGPGVPRLEPPRPAPPPEADPYCVAWDENNARGEGKAKGSKLTNRVEDEFTINYDVELKRGAQTVVDLQANRGPLAGGLGEDVDRVLFKKAPRGAGAAMAQLTIITRDPVAETRFWAGPRVEDGVIKRVARFVDGHEPDADVMMWDDRGTVPTMVVGSTGGGKSGAANVLTCGAMASGVMNLLYADPKGNSSTALATRARVAIIGKSNVLKLPWLLVAMLDARGNLAAQLRADQIFPSAQIPGWEFLHDEYSLIASDPMAMRVWTETVNTVRALGIWPVALNQSLAVPQWGNDHARSAFASQVIAFRINSNSSSDLVPGLIFDPADLPVDDSGPVARPVAGMAVHAHLDTPTRWDFLPSEADAARMKERGKPAPPYTTTSAFDLCFPKCPPVHRADEIALETILGPAVNGRWQVGGPGATHRFPDSLEELRDKGTPGAPAATPKGRWGQRGGKSSSDGQLSPAQTEVLAIVRGGTSKTGDIIDAAKASRSSVMDALDTLSSLGLICRTAHGVYEPTKQDA